MVPSSVVKLPMHSCSSQNLVSPAWLAEPTSSSSLGDSDVCSASCSAGGGAGCVSVSVVVAAGSGVEVVELELGLLPPATAAITKTMTTKPASEVKHPFMAEQLTRPARESGLSEQQG